MPVIEDSGIPRIQSSVPGEAPVVGQVGHPIQFLEYSSRIPGIFVVTPIFCLIRLSFRKGLWACLNTTSFIVSPLDEKYGRAEMAGSIGYGEGPKNVG